MSNKFSHRRRHPRRPPICLTKPPPKPYEYPPYPYPGDGGELSAGQAWALRATLPAVPDPDFDTIHFRNLAFHLYPRNDNAIWRVNLTQIRKRWHRFNGRRVIAVTTGPGLVPLSRLRPLLPNDAEIIQIPNDPRLRETTTFLPLLSRLRSVYTDEATFYCHTKGASPHNANDPRNAYGIRLWRDRMYHELLDDWPAVQSGLREYATIGCFKIDYSHFPGHVMRSPTGLEWGTWHYAGNFHWFRHDQIFRNPHWSEIADDPYAVEMWLGNLIDTKLAGTIYQPWPPTEHPPPDLYDPANHADPIS